MANAIQQMILDQARRTGADPLTLLATAIVESNLNPNAVGDGGTSYGLFQMHVGGAGGATQASARRYLDPMAAIENRARAFRGGAGGAFAASVQRPADAAGYARKVDAVIAQLRAGKLPGGSGYLNAPVAGNAGSGTSNGASGDGSKAAAISLIFGNDPVFQMAAQDGGANTASAANTQPGGSMEGKGFFARRKGETGQQYLDRLLQKKFGLKHDPGNAQTTGGHHSGRGHYDGRATDFGNARNSPATLQAAEDWLEANRNNLVGGLKLSLYGANEDPNHADHLHAETFRSLRTPKQRSRFA